MRKPMQKIVCMGMALTLAASSASATDWGLWYGNGIHQPPSGEESVESLAQYQAYYMGSPSQKILYLTFDCGYENGNTAKILDTLKKHHAPGAFFVVGHYLDSSPDLVKRMAAEGHLVGNHTDNHLNLTKIGQSRFTQEVNTVAEQYKQITGREIDPFLRPPEGSYTHQNLQWAQSLGYYTTLWSVAYADWDVDNQPSYDSALRTIRNRAHNGAIILLHAISSTNATILDELLTGWEAEGYQFAALTSLPGISEPTVSAIPNPTLVTVDNMQTTPTVYQVNKRNYIRLRDLARILLGTASSFAVSYDDKTNSVLLDTNGIYSTREPQPTGAKDVAALQARPSRQSIRINGVARNVNTYFINGENYVFLYDIASALNFYVSDTDGKLIIDTTRPYEVAK